MIVMITVLFEELLGSYHQNVLSCLCASLPLFFCIFEKYSFYIIKMLCDLGLILVILLGPGVSAIKGSKLASEKAGELGVKKYKFNGLPKLNRGSKS